MTIYNRIKNMTEIDKLEEEVLDKLKPCEEEVEEVKRVSQQLEEEINELTGDEIKTKLVGSVAKDTFLRDPDIDMFVLFPQSMSKEEMTERGLSLGRELLDNIEEKYAEHPYLHGTYDGYKTDIVPCYDVDDITEMRSSVDRTPLHTEYVIEHLKDELRDDVLLLKAFLKGIGAYSAEAKVQGFSGYLCELLIIYYDGFHDLLESSSEWIKGTRLEFEGSDERFDETFTFIDPVDPRRNVASALSSEKMFLFIYAAKRYLDEPRIEFYLPNPLRFRSEGELIDLINERGTDIISISFARPDIVEDNLYPQVQKAHRRTDDHLVKNDFSVLHSDHFVGKENIHIIFELEERKLPLTKKHRGPPVSHENAKYFREKYGKRVYIEVNRLMVDRKRKFSDALDLIDHLVENIDLGGDISKALKEEYDVHQNEELASDYPETLNKFLDRSFPWER